MSNTTASVKVPVKSYPGVKHVETAPNYKLMLEFDNGEKKVFDVTPLLSIGRFQTLTAIEVFKKVHVSFDTVEWENGLDLDPEYLYEQSLLLQK